MMDQKDFLKFEEWRRFAEEDLCMAELGLKEQGPSNQICFHAQQIAEKYLKGFLVLNKSGFEKLHQLPYLLDLCIKIDATFEELKEDTFYLTRFYIETRYPGDYPEFSLNDAKKAYAVALRIKNFVLSKVKLSS